MNLKFKKTMPFLALCTLCLSGAGVKQNLQTNAQMEYWDEFVGGATVKNDFTAYINGTQNYYELIGSTNLTYVNLHLVIESRTKPLEIKIKDLNVYGKENYYEPFIEHVGSYYFELTIKYEGTCIFDYYSEAIRNSYNRKPAIDLRGIRGNFVAANSNSRLTIRGANGKNGSNGSIGSTGYTGTSYRYDGGKGGRGGDGTNGENGAKGCNAINCDTIDLSKADNLYVAGGHGGNGGIGGKGGTGGRGGNGGDKFKGNGGDGGDGGTGGLGGLGGGAGYPIVAWNIAGNGVSSSFQYEKPVDGKQGRAGYGGEGGKPGNGSIMDTFLGIPYRIYLNGIKGKSGDKGDNGLTGSILRDTQSKSKWENIKSTIDSYRE